MLLYLHRKPILDAVHSTRRELVGRLLDVGCGDKPYASILQCREHVGVDLASSLHSRGKIDIFYDGKTLPFEGEEFDSVLCTEVLEHCADPQSLVREIARVLKPGGFALITAPMVIHHHEVPSDFQRFTRYGMEYLVKQSGLDVVWTRPRGGVYSTFLGVLYTAVGYSLSRRPFIDIVLWLLWPVSMVILVLEKIITEPAVMSLGWQTFVRKPKN